MTDPMAPFSFSLLGLMQLRDIHLLSHFPSAQENRNTGDGAFAEMSPPS